jgi:hypothetical protein
VKVLVNGYGVDFSIENEKTLNDVVSSILKWTKERDLIFTDLYVEGELYSVDKLPDRALDEISEINCIVQSKADLIISTMNEAVSYCDRILYHTKNAENSGHGDFSQKESLYKGIDWLSEAANVIFALLVVNENEIRYLDHPISFYFDALKNTRDKVTAIKDEKIYASFLSENKNLFETIKAVFKMLFLSENLKMIILKGLESPNQLIEGLIKVKKDIPDQISHLESAAVAFQSGRDADGAEMLQGFIDFIYRYIRLCHQISPVFGINPVEVVSGDMNLDQLNATIYAFLEEIVSVMENNDIISLSDILEYQMKGEIEKCSSFIDLLLEKIS